MTPLVEFLLFILLMASAILALQVRDVLAAGVATSIFSFITAILFVAMGAVDVGFTEAAVGAGILGVYLVALVYRTTRRTRD